MGSRNDSCICEAAGREEDKRAAQVDVIMWLPIDIVVRRFRRLSVSRFPYHAEHVPLAVPIRYKEGRRWSSGTWNVLYICRRRNCGGVVGIDEFVQTLCSRPDLRSG